MSSINRQSGWYGYTIDTTGNTTNDHGETTTCIFGVNYAYHVNDVDVKISNNENDWGAQMGDGTIIPLSDPQILYQHRTNAVIQFTMKKEYASNTPCTLVYLSDTAYIAITDNPTANRPFEIHTATGKFAMTVDRYGATITEDGEVDKLIATIYYPYFAANHTFEIATEDGCWSARMGNGDIISLTNPEILAVNKDNAVVLFDMDQVYPSNSPCLLLANTERSIFTITPIADKFTFIPVEDIVDCPTEIIGGLNLDLSSTTVKPYNATNKSITWEIISGSTGTADLNDQILYAKQPGIIKLRATIKDGVAIGTNKVKEFTINVIKNEITILADIDTYMKPIVDEIDQYLAIIADSVNKLIRIQWYYTKTKITEVTSGNFNTINAEELPNGNNSIVYIPTEWIQGEYYVFCKISSPEAEDVFSKVCHVHVLNRCQSFHIVPANNNFKKVENTQSPIEIRLESSMNFTIELIPEIGEVEKVKWFILDDPAEVAKDAKNTGNFIAKVESKEMVDADGVSIRHGCTVTVCHRWGATFRLKAVGYCGITKLEDTITIRTADFYPVSHLDNLLMEIETLENEDQDTTLRATVISTVAGKEPTNKNIKWEIVQESNNEKWTKDNKVYIHYQDPIHNDEEIFNTEAILENGNKLVAKKPGWIKVRATIVNGLAPHDTHLEKEEIDVIKTAGYDYVFEYMVKVTQAFIPVEDMELTSKTTGVVSGNRLRLEADPKSGTIGNTTNSSKREYDFTVVDPGTTGVKLQGNTLVIPNNGTMRVRGRVPNGKMTNHGPGDDFTKDFDIVVTNDGFVSVEDVNITFSPAGYEIVFDENGNKSNAENPSPEMFNSNNITNDGAKDVSNTMNIAITPINATNQNVNITIVKPSDDERYDYYDGEETEDLKPGETIIGENIGSIVKMSTSGSNRTVSIPIENINTIDSGIQQYFIIDLEIVNAINKTTTFTKRVVVNVLPVDLDAFYPLQDMTLVSPKPSRVLIPILLDHSKFFPSNASILTSDGRPKSMISFSYEEFEGENDDNRVDAQLITVGTDAAGNHLTMVDWLKDVYTNDAIDWNLTGVYYYPWSIGTIFIKATVPDATVEDAANNVKVYRPEIIPFEKVCTIDILDPYIAVKDLKLPLLQKNQSGGNPLIQIPVNKEIVLDIELDTKGGINYYNPDWDDDKPSYDIPEYRIDVNNGGLTLNNNVTVNVEEYHNGDEADNSNIINFETVEINNEAEHGIIKATSILSDDNKHTITISIRNGKKETACWYGNVQNGVAFEKSFDVKVVNRWEKSSNTSSVIQNAAKSKISSNIDLSNSSKLDSSGRYWIKVKDKKYDENDTEEWNAAIQKAIEDLDVSWSAPTNNDICIPFAVLSDSSSNTLEVYDIYDLTWCANSKPSSFVMNINGKSMRKDAVTKIEFSDVDAIKNAIKTAVKAEFDKYKVNVGLKIGTDEDDKNIFSSTIIDIGSDAYNQFETWLDNLPVNAGSESIKYLINFARNFTNLTQINKIPRSVISLKGFMQGCTKFNSTITIPSSVKGSHCMKDFLKDCTSFNSTITFEGNCPNLSSTDEGVMEGFLEGCTSYNKPLTIPSTVSGRRCMARILRNCTSFNSTIIFPENATGEKFLYMGLEGCTKLNKPLTLPRGIWTSEGALYSFLGRADSFISEITVHPAPGIDSNGDSRYDEDDYVRFINEHTFSTRPHLSDLAAIGIMFKCTETPQQNGLDGANMLCRLTTNKFNALSTLHRNVHSLNCTSCPYHSNCDKLIEEDELIAEGILDNQHHVIR